MVYEILEDISLPLYALSGFGKDVVFLVLVLLMVGHRVRVVQLERLDDGGQQLL